MTRSGMFKQVASTTALSLLARVSMMVLAYATQLCLAWLYGPALMGTFFIAANLAIILGYGCTLGLDNGMLRFSALLQEQGKASLVGKLARRSASLVLIISSLIAGGIYLARSTLAQYFHAPALPAMLFFFMLALPLIPVVNILRETLRGMGAVLWATSSQCVIQPGSLLACILLFYFAKSWQIEMVTALATAFFVSIMLTLLLLLLSARPDLHRGQTQSTQKLPWKDLLRYSCPLYLGALLLLLWGYADSLILALFRPPQEVAYYGVAFKIAGLVLFPTFAVHAVVPPLFVQFYHRREISNLEQLARTTARWSFCLALPACLLLTLIASELLGFFGPDFSAARWALSVLVLGQLVASWSGAPLALLSMTGHQQTALKVQGGAVALTLPLMFVLSYFYGITGLALAAAIGWAFMHILGTWSVRKILFIDSFANNIILLSVVSLLAYGISWLISLRCSALWASLSFSFLYLIILLTVAVRQKEFNVFRSDIV